MSDKIEKLIKDGFEQADSPAKKVGLAAAVVAAGPAVIAGIASEKVFDGAKAGVEMIKKESVNAQFKKYNPVFREQYIDPEFSMPSLIRIVDDAERKDIEVCKNSIGWKSVENGLEVFHMYDTFINESKVGFSPVPMCDSFYYVDPHNSNCYININNLFERMQQEKIAELTDVANCLGAKSYVIEIVEEEKKHEKNTASARMGVNVKVVDAGLEGNHTREGSQFAIRRAYSTAEFYEKRKPVMPTLCWFKDDNNILGLIRHVCRDHARIKSQELVFEGSKHAVMSQETAVKIDAVIKKIGGKNTAKLEKKAESEFSSRIFFRIEF